MINYHNKIIIYQRIFNILSQNSYNFQIRKLIKLLIQIYIIHKILVLNIEEAFTKMAIKVHQI